MVMTAASAAYLNHALEPTPNSLRSCVAPALGRGSPQAFGCQGDITIPQPVVQAVRQESNQQHKRKVSCGAV